MNGFCLKEGQGLKALAAHPHPNFPSSAPPPPGRMFTTQKETFITTDYTGFTNRDR